MSHVKLVCELPRVLWRTCHPGVFLSSHVPSAITPLFLCSYVLKTLLIDSAAWEDVSTVSVRTQARLCHLQSLFLALEEKAHGSALDGVLLMYREPLPPELRGALKVAIASFDLAVLVPVVRDFMTDQLTKVRGS